MNDKAHKYRGYHVFFDYNGIFGQDSAELTSWIMNTIEGILVANNVNFVHKHAVVFDGTESPPGFTSVFLIDKSHVSAHCYSELGLLALDIFTCGGRPDITKKVADEIHRAVLHRFPNCINQVTHAKRFPVADYATGKFCPFQPVPAAIFLKKGQIKSARNIETDQTTKDKEKSSDGISEVGTKYRGYHVFFDYNGIFGKNSVELTSWIMTTIEGILVENNVNFVHKHAVVFDGTESPPGFTSVFLIDKSHVSAHCYSELGLLALDIFTCGGRPDITKKVADEIHRAVLHRFLNCINQVTHAKRFPVADNAPSKNYLSPLSSTANFATE